MGEVIYGVDFRKGRDPEIDWSAWREAMVTLILETAASDEDTSPCEMAPET